jgi:hypothetical protein
VGKANRQRRQMKEKEKEKERKRTTPRCSASDPRPIEERAALDLATALRALADDDRGAFAAASARVADQSRSAGSRRATERLLADYLQSVVSGRPWEPHLVRSSGSWLSGCPVRLYSAGDGVPSSSAACS